MNIDTLNGTLFGHVSDQELAGLTDRYCHYVVLALQSTLGLTSGQTIVNPPRLGENPAPDLWNVLWGL